MGQAPGNDASLAHVRDFVEDVREALVESVDEDVAADHLHAMAQAAQQRPVAAPRDPRRRPALRLSPLPALAVSALALCLALGSFGALPGPVQARLADASRAVGIPLPQPGKPEPKRSDPDRSAPPSSPIAPAPAPAWHPAPTVAPAPPPVQAEPQGCVPPDNLDATCEDEPTLPDPTTTPPETETPPAPTPAPDPATEAALPDPDGGQPAPGEGR
jgi:hypothetical protein